MEVVFKPLISIIIPTYNRGHILSQTIESVLSQTYINWECLIVDDGSKDDTAKVVNSYKDPRIRYYFKEHEDRSAARNFGIKNAKGEYYQFLDSDDLITPRKLELAVKELEKREYNGDLIIISNFRIISEDSYKSTKPYCEIKENLFSYKSILYNWDVTFTIPIHCAIFDCRLFVKFEFPPHINYKEDWLMWLYIFQKDITVIFIDQPLALYRIRKNITPEELKNNEENEIKVLKYLGDYISEKDQIEFYYSLIHKKQAHIRQLTNSIKNFQSTRAFKFFRIYKSFLKKGGGIG